MNCTSSIHKSINVSQSTYEHANICMYSFKNNEITYIHILSCKYIHSYNIRDEIYVLDAVSLMMTKYWGRHCSQTYSTHLIFKSKKLLIRKKYMYWIYECMYVSCLLLVVLCFRFDFSPSAHFNLFSTTSLVPELVAFFKTGVDLFSYMESFLCRVKERNFSCWHSFICIDGRYHL